MTEKTNLPRVKKVKDVRIMRTSLKDKWAEPRLPNFTVECLAPGIDYFTDSGFATLAEAKARRRQLLHELRGVPAAPRPHTHHSSARVNTDLGIRILEIDQFLYAPSHLKPAPLKEVPASTERSLRLQLRVLLSQPQAAQVSHEIADDIAAQLLRDFAIEERTAAATSADTVADAYRSVAKWAAEQAQKLAPSMWGLAMNDVGAEALRRADALAAQRTVEL